MKIQWTRVAQSDLVRLYEHLKPVAPAAAARMVRSLARAPDRLAAFPRLGEKLDAFAPREVRRIIVSDYELRYELTADAVIVLRLWHCREHRSLGPESS
jgi:plasmid stabilization system protein ParE